MAAPSPWRLPFNSATTTSPNSSLIFPIYSTKRRSLLPWSSNFDSSAASSCRFCVFNKISSDAEQIVKRQTVETLTVDGDSKNGEVSKFKYSVNGRRLSFNSLFGKQALWRRTLFGSARVRSIILLNAITIIYASNIPVVKEVEAIVDPEAFTVIRFAVAAIPFIPFVLRAGKDAHTRNAGVELGFWIGLGYITQALGLLTSDAGRAAVISMFTVIVVPLIDGMLGSDIPAHTWFGALMSIIGVAMLESSGSPPCIGDLLVFLSAVSFGIHMLRTEHISRRTKRENFLALLGYEVCVVAILSAAWYLTKGWSRGAILDSNPFSWRWETFCNWISSFPWIPSFYTGIFSTGLCLWVEMSSMCDVSATEAAIIYGLEPVWGAGFAWFFLGERWGVIGWIGAALVLGGSLTVQILGAKSESLSRECEIGKGQSNEFLISDKNNGFPTSPIVVNRNEDSPDLIKK